MCAMGYGSRSRMCVTLVVWLKTNAFQKSENCLYIFIYLWLIWNLGPNLETYGHKSPGHLFPNLILYQKLPLNYKGSLLL